MPYGVQPSLPTELYRPIVENLEHDTATLLVVLLASKTLQLEIERFIYRRMVQKNEINQQKFLTSILESPRRALLVEEYSQEGVSYTAKVRLWSLLCRALNCMQNLKHFTIRTTLITGLPTEFHGRYTFRLKTLDLRGPCSGDKLIITFLQFQTQLDSLSIEWSKTNEQLILPSTCPQLRFLRGNKGAVETFLPGRSIFSLVWVPHPADSTTCVSHLAFAFNNIRTLSYGGFLGCPDLNLIIRHLRSLEILRIVDPTLNVRTIGSFSSVDRASNILIRVGARFTLSTTESSDSNSFVSTHQTTLLCASLRKSIGSGDSRHVYLMRSTPAY